MAAAHHKAGRNEAAYEADSPGNAGAARAHPAENPSEVGTQTA